MSTIYKYMSGGCTLLDMHQYLLYIYTCILLATLNHQSPTQPHNYSHDNENPSLLTSPPLHFPCPRSQPQMWDLRPRLNPPSLPCIQPMLPIQTLEASLMGRQCAQNAGWWPDQAPVLVKPGGQEICGANCIRQADHTEPHVYCEG